MSYAEALISMGVDHDTVAKFQRYHATHRHLWPEFERRALAEIATGKERISGKAIAEDMRKVVTDEGDPFGIDNRWVSYYVRIFILKHPHLNNRVERRVTVGVKSGEDAYGIAKTIRLQTKSGAGTIGIRDAGETRGGAAGGAHYVQQQLLEPPRGRPAIWSENV